MWLLIIVGYTNTLTYLSNQIVSSVRQQYMLDSHSYNKMQVQLEGKYSLESTDPRESEIRAPPQPLPYLIPIPPNTLFYNKWYVLIMQT